VQRKESENLAYRLHFFGITLEELRNASLADYTYYINADITLYIKALAALASQVK